MIQPNFFKGPELNKNFFREIRESLMISKAELTKKANISPPTALLPSVYGW